MSRTNSRTRSALIGLSVVTLVACGQSRDQSETKTEVVSSATAPNEMLIASDSIGPAILGITPNQLSSKLKVVRETNEIVFEDMTEPVAVLAFLGDTIRAGLDSGKIYRLSVRSPRFRTSDSISVGTPITRFLSEPGVYALAAEGQATLWSPSHCGIGFRLQTAEGEEGPDGLGDYSDSVGLTRLRELTKTTKVGEITVFGCK